MWWTPLDPPVIRHGKNAGKKGVRGSDGSAWLLHQSLADFEPHQWNNMWLIWLMSKILKRPIVGTSNRHKCEANATLGSKQSTMYHGEFTNEIVCRNSRANIIGDGTYCKHTSRGWKEEFHGEEKPRFEINNMIYYQQNCMFLGWLSTVTPAIVVSFDLSEIASYQRFSRFQNHPTGHHDEVGSLVKKSSSFVAPRRVKHIHDIQKYIYIPIGSMYGI